MPIYVEPPGYQPGGRDGGGWNRSCAGCTAVLGSTFYRHRILLR
ncbi:hypothetical protein HD597_003897 [Nonomuraea thailandensis]|uniref:Uncharacterized protein n=1 Tax=Nonomuraea thailandensis TaxID=1188745 RepID=A0A9X2GFU1_9ACTN|nr:hypothetical protein [Nonomuraea thailandensis]MCP2356877.1 hypothetical protein [Nonomuraea thailandensis]